MLMLLCENEEEYDAICAHVAGSVAGGCAVLYHSMCVWWAVVMVRGELFERRERKNLSRCLVDLVMMRMEPNWGGSLLEPGMCVCVYMCV